MDTYTDNRNSAQSQGAPLSTPEGAVARAWRYARRHLEYPVTVMRFEKWFLWWVYAMVMWSFLEKAALWIQGALL